jgi:hypothetical protein
MPIRNQLLSALAQYVRACASRCVTVRHCVIMIIRSSTYPMTHFVTHFSIGKVRHRASIAPSTLLVYMRHLFYQYA